MPEIPNINTRELEGLLVSIYRPYFFTLGRFNDDDHPFIHIVICSKQFNGLSVNERIVNIFNLIKQSKLDIINNITLIIEAFTANELNDLLDYLD